MAPKTQAGFGRAGHTRKSTPMGGGEVGVEQTSRGGGWLGESAAGVISTLAVILLVGVVGALMWTLRPPSVEDVERDIWRDWARQVTDSQGLTLADQLVEDRRPTGQ